VIRGVAQELLTEAGGVAGPVEEPGQGVGLGEPDQLALHPRHPLGGAQAGMELMILIDIDHFKAVNDQHGHDVGDTVIRGVAQELLTEPGQGVGLGEPDQLALHPRHPLGGAQAGMELLGARRTGPAPTGGSR
jgi:hypothetical protein